MYRRTYMEINIDNLYQNYDLFKAKTNKKIIAVVKANAYGLVDYKIAELLQEKGCDFFAVSSIEEAIRLRQHNIESDILIMGYANDLEIIKKNNFSIIIPDAQYVNDHINDLKDVKVHLKINTGLNRLGIFKEEANEILNKLIICGANVEGVMTHYACNDDVDYTYSQYYLFKDIVEHLNYDFKYIHSSATDASMYLEDDFCNCIRLGLGLSGYANIENDWNLKPVISLYAEIISCKKVLEGEGVSYGHHYISDGNGYINTIAIGYADGLDKKLENKKVYIGDEEGVIVGSVCMDLILVKTEHYHKPGELVEIIGRHKSVENMRDELDVCCCKIITGISERVTRIYIKDNKVIDEINLRK